MRLWLGRSEMEGQVFAVVDGLPFARIARRGRVGYALRWAAIALHRLAVREVVFGRRLGARRAIDSERATYRAARPDSDAVGVVITAGGTHILSPKCRIAHESSVSNSSG